MKIVVNDHSGHAFTLQLSRQFAQSGHEVLHAYSVSFQSPKGNFEDLPLSGAPLKVLPVMISGTFDKYSLLKRQLAQKTIYCFHDDNFIDWRFNSFKDYYSGVECYKYDESNFFSGYYEDGFYFITEFYCSSISKFLSMTSFVCSKYENLLRIKFVSNEAKISKIIPFLGFVRFRTLTNIVLFSLNNKIMDEIKGEKMYYTLLDSDENI